MAKARLIRSGLTMLVVAGLTMVAGCGNGLSKELDGSIDLGTSAGLTTVPGKIADYTGFLANHSRQVVILKSARLLTLRGFRSPRLVRVGIEPNRAFIASGLDWPPDHYGEPVLSLSGFRLRPGRRAQILYGVVAPRVAEYGDAGVQVTMTVAGTTVTVIVLSAAATCVKHSLDINCPNSFFNRIQNAADAPDGGVGAVAGQVIR